MSGKKLFIVTIPIHSSSFFPSTLSNQANTQPVLLLPRTTVTSMSAKSDKIIFVLFYLIFFNRTQKSFLFTWKVLVLALILVRVLWRNRTNTKLEIYIWRERTIYTHIQLCVYSHAIAIAKSLQSCPTLCDPIDGSPPGFPVPGILQARTLEWVAISFSNA